MQGNAQTGTEQGKSKEKKTRNTNGENGWGNVGCELGRGLGGFVVSRWILIRFIGAYWNVVGGYLFSK